MRVKVALFVFANDRTSRKFSIVSYDPALNYFLNCVIVLCLPSLELLFLITSPRCNTFGTISLEETSSYAHYIQKQSLHWK